MSWFLISLISFHEKKETTNENRIYYINELALESFTLGDAQ